MGPQHEARRRELVARYGSSHCNCGVFARAFVKSFPELRKVAGFYYAPDSSACYGEHWWLEDAQGCIVDPTADQFPCRGAGRYVRYDPKAHKVVKGKCPNCGTGLYSRESAYPCSRACDEAFSREYEVRLSGGPYEDEMSFSSDADITEKYGIAFKTPF